MKVNCPWPAAEPAAEPDSELRSWLQIQGSCHATASQHRAAAMKPSRMSLSFFLLAPLTHMSLRRQVTASLLAVAFL